MAVTVVYVAVVREFATSYNTYKVLQLTVHL